tara:strand:+ start:330 stop:761 length:432 start_codon:yes stop_codon:yes gene_type:complete
MDFLYNNSKDQLQNRINQRQSVPSTMNFPLHNNTGMPLDRAMASNKQPVQSTIQSQYEFDKMNIMELPKQNVFMDNRPIDTRRQQYDTTKKEDDLFYKNQQGTLYNYTEHKPSNTRLYENKRLVGVDFNLLPHKQQHIPKENI